MKKVEIFYFFNGMFNKREYGTSLTQQIQTETVNTQYAICRAFN